jgi:hypothetical protein
MVNGLCDVRKMRTVPALAPARLVAPERRASV